MKMKRILYIIGQLGIGGAERQLLYLCQYLNRNMFEPLVVSLSEDIQLKPQFDELGVQVIVFPKTTNPDLTRPFKLARVIKEYQPDLIHAYLFVANTWARIVGACFKVPVILSERSAKDHRGALASVLEWALYPLGDRLIANSQSGAQQIVKNKSIDPKKVRVVHNGLLINKYINQELKPKESLRFEFGIKTHTKVIGMVANFFYVKNHEFLFDAYHMIKSNFTDSRILCVGDGKRLLEMQNYAKNIGIGKDVIFAGSRSDIPSCLSLMDVLVLPSRWEGLPNAILEGMAAGCPVVATNVGGIPELIRDGETGLLIEPGDIEGLAKAIVDILERRVDVDSMTEHALSLVANEFSVENMVRQTERIYNEVLGPNSDSHSAF